MKRFIRRPTIRPLRFIRRVYAPYGRLSMRQRFFAGISAGFVIVGMGAWGAYSYYDHSLYILGDRERALLGTKHLEATKVRQTATGYEYQPDAAELASLDHDSIVGSDGLDAGSGAAPARYQATLPKNFSDGITVGEPAGDLTMTLKPQHQAGEAKYEEGRVFYPEGLNTKYVYTFKQNGIKEDIVLSKAPGDEVRYAWTMGLGDHLEARVQEDGSVGIYSADPNLYGQLTISDDKSRTLIENARKNGQKDHLAFLIPTPYLTLPDGKQVTDGLRFSVDGDQLVLTVSKLRSYQYPLSIDPTVVVTTTANFRTGSDDGNIDYTGTADQVTRSAVSGGTLSTAWGSAGNTISSGRYGHAAVAYNGYLYIVGGYDGADQNDVQYATINSNGTVSSFVSAGTGFTNGRYFHAVLAYNNRLYVLGGKQLGSGTKYNDLQYATINSNGTIGSWASDTTNLYTDPRWGLSAVEYNGYMYITGGYNDTTYYNDVQYAQFQPDGSLSAFASTGGSGFTTARYIHTTVAYNNYLYIIGGASSSTYLNTIYYARINADGTVSSTWDAGATFSIGRYGHTSFAYKGYMYVIGGQQTTSTTTCKSSGTSPYCSDVQYALIRSDGSLDTWATDGSHYLGVDRVDHAGVAYNGYLYTIGGYNAGTFYQDVQYSQISTTPSTVGTVPAWTNASNNFTTARYGHGSIAYNGYLYASGGYGNATTLFSDGFESNDISNWTGHSVPLYPTTQSTAKYSGTYAAQISDTVGAASYRAMDKSVTASSFLKVSARVCFASSSGDYPIMVVSSSTGDLYIYRRSNGYLHVWNTWNSRSSQFDSSSPISQSGSSCTNTADWYLMEVELDRAATTMSIYLNGSSVFYYDSTTDVPDNLSLGSANLDQLQIGDGTAKTQNWYIDDVVVTNSAASYLDTTYYAAIGTDGAVGTWSPTATLLEPRAGFGMVAYNGYAYVIGGATTGGTLRNTSYIATINSNGTLGSWSSTGTANFTTARWVLGAAAYNGYLYISGGEIGSSTTSCKDSGTSNKCNDTQYIQLNSNGTMNGSWAGTGANNFTTPRGYHDVVAYGGYLYVGGGIDSSSTRLSSVYKVPINSNGTLGTWATANAFTTGRDGIAMIAYNGYMYAIGGEAGSGGTTTVNRGLINSDGTITWQSNTTGMNTGRSGIENSTVGYGGRIYVTGGYNASAVAQTSTEYARLNAAANESVYERVLDTGVNGTNTRVDSIVTNGTWPCGTQLSYRTASSSGTWSAATTLPFITPGQTVTITTTNVRYVWVKYVMSDQACGTQSNITDITLNWSYTSAPPAPTLSVPANAATAVSTTPSFQLRTTQLNDGYLQYKIDVCSTSNCSSIVRTIDQTSSQTGWTGQDQQTGTAYTGSSVAIGSSTMAYHSYQTPALSNSTQYWWRAYAIDPGNSNSWSAASSINSFTTTANATPSAPTLSVPADGATGVSSTPTFQMSTTDGDGDYLRYKIEVCSTSNCSSVVRTIDQTSSQTGWTGQNTQTSTAYTSGTTATHAYQTPALSNSTQYWWRAYAVDSGGSNGWSAASSIRSFTTAAPANTAPTAPTLALPADGSGGGSYNPSFQLSSTDADGDYIRYQIQVCSTSNCSSVVRTIDQTASQTGWTGQNTQGNTAYTSGTQAVHSYQNPALSANTQYWWRAYAKDPGGTNNWSSASAIYTFVTAPVSSVKTDVKGGTTIRGGSSF